MNYLHAYIIGSQSMDEIDSYDKYLLEGHEPYLISTFSVIGSYSNISSISNWDIYGQHLGLSYYNVSDEISNYWETELAGTWSSLDVSDKEILAKYFLVDKPKRDEVLSDEEQDLNDYYIIYKHLNEDAKIKMWNLDHKISPKSVDYKKDVDTRFHPKSEFDDNGFLTKCEYFENLETVTDEYGFTTYNYSNPVLLYSASYSQSDNGYVESRIVERKWYLASGTYSNDSKISVKYYDPLSARAEGRRRRKNLISNVLIKTVGLFVLTSVDLDNVVEAEEDAMILMDDISAAISEYYEYGNKIDTHGNPCKLIQKVIGSTYSRLDNFVPGTGDTVTIRDFILSKINI